MLKRLFAWAHVVDVKVFTFYDKDYIRLIGSADVFFMSGGNEDNMIKLFKENRTEMQAVRDLATNGGIYIGSCGGAMAAGKFWTPSSTRSNGEVEMLNLFDGVDVGVDEPDYAAQTSKPYIHLTDRTGALVVGKEWSAIYITKGGSCKNADETRALQRQLDDAMKRPTGTTCTPQPTTTPTRPSSDNVDYAYCDHKFRAWIPECRPSRITVYFPSTWNEQPPVGHHEEAVFMPTITEHSNKPYKIDVPTWIEEWLSWIQVVFMPNIPLRIFGCSRGAAWAFKLYARPLRRSLCQKAVLICPYKLGSWGEEHFTETMVDAFKKQVQRDPSSITIVHSSNDAWPAPPELICIAKEYNPESVVELERSHEDMLNDAKKWW